MTACTLLADLVSILEAQRRQKPANMPTYNESTFAHHAIMRHMQTRGTPPEPMLATGACQLRLQLLEALESESCYMSSIWHIAHEAMAMTQASATQMGITLNSLLLGTLAWVLHDVSEQQCFAISQTYLGRTVEELRAVGSYSVSVPMVFDFSAEPSLQAVCGRVQRQTQQVLARDVIVQSTQRTTVAYELNDVRPIKRPVEAKHQLSAFVGHTFNFVDLFFYVNQHSDGYVVSVLYDKGTFDAAWVDECVENWMGWWHGMHYLPS